MPPRIPLALLTLSAAMVGAAAADEATPAPDDEADDEDEHDYAEKDVIELGGSAAASWTEALFTLTVGPSIGWFIIQHFELSALIRFQYTNPDGAPSTKSGSFVLEPSYHIPVANGLYVFGGLGVGVGYDGDNADFELIPRVGLNIQVGASGVFTPAIDVPIIVDENGTDVGFIVEAGFTTTW